MSVDERMKQRTFSIAMMIQSYSDETGSCRSTWCFAYLIWNRKPYNPLSTWVHH